MIALIVCALLWIVAGIIVAIQEKTAEWPSSVFILALILSLGILRRSVSITLTACLISVSVIVSGMAPIITTFHNHTHTAQGVAYLLNYMAAVFCVLWCCFDLCSLNAARATDRIALRDGWSTLN